MAPHINIFAVFAAALSTLVLGGFWYSPRLFGTKRKHGALPFVLNIVFSFVAAAAFARFAEPSWQLSDYVRASLMVGVCWVATCFGTNYAFAGRGPKLFLIDAGYHVAQFLLYGVILGSWR